MILGLKVNPGPVSGKSRDKAGNVVYSFEDYITRQSGRLTIICDGCARPFPDDVIVRYWLLDPPVYLAHTTSVCNSAKCGKKKQWVIPADPEMPWIIGAKEAVSNQSLAPRYSTSALKGLGEGLQRNGKRKRQTKAEKAAQSNESKGGPSAESSNPPKKPKACSMNLKQTTLNSGSWRLSSSFFRNRTDSPLLSQLEPNPEKDVYVPTYTLA